MMMSVVSFCSNVAGRSESDMASLLHNELFFLCKNRFSRLLCDPRDELGLCLATRLLHSHSSLLQRSRVSEIPARGLF